MVCLKCEQEIKLTSFQFILETSPRRICRTCEEALQPYFKLHEDVFVCFQLGEGLEALMNSINKGDTVLIEGLAEIIKRHAFRTFKCHKHYILLKETLEDEMYEGLSKKLLEGSSNKFEKMYVRLY